MLPPAKSYDDLIDRFSWKIPERYNLGVDVCDKWAKSEPERLAIIDLTGDQRRGFSFEELKQRSDQMAVYLLDLGIEQGDRVCVFLTQSI